MSQRLIDILSRTDVWAVAIALVGFLTLTWAIRGAPMGQPAREEPEDSPPAGYRDRVVALAVVGFLMVVAGAYLAISVGIPWSLPAFGSGFAIVLGVLRANRRYRHVSPTLRRVLEFSGTALTASLVAGILVVGNVVAFKYGGRAIDLTRDRVYSLSSKTVNLLRSLDRPVTFTVYYGNSEPSVRQHERIRQLLELYKAADPSRVRVEYLDQFMNTKEFEELARRVPEMAASRGDGVVVSYGEGEAVPRAVLANRDLFEGPGARVDPRENRVLLTFNGEDVVTSALIRLREGKRSMIGFTVGHGEPPSGELDPSQPGVGVWRARLASVGVDAVEVNLVRDEVPSACPLLAICGPRSPFGTDEVERIRSFIARGGQLMVFVGNTDPTGLDDLLRNYNVEIGKGMVFDPRYNYRKQPYLVYAPMVPGNRHPITETLQGRVAFVQNAAPIAVLGPPTPGKLDPTPRRPANPGVEVAPFLRTSPESWVEAEPDARPYSRDPAREAAGPVAVGAAVSIRPAIASEKPTPRMVVFSTAHLADNRILYNDPTNLDLIMNALYWLKGKPEMQGIDPKNQETLIFAADPGLALRLVMVPTLMAIVVIVGLGLTTYLARRD